MPTQQEIPYRAAAYLRLSREDGDKAESDSIQSQRALITRFVQSMPDICLCSEHVDDGFSGVDFNRPAFQRMMEDVKAGKINCIVVKDLSRFGRNYIEAGRYLERIFPFLGVRFIAVNDGYDSAKERTPADEILIPFKNLINDAYSRDISVKIRSQLEIKRQKGEFIGSFPPYGYLKSNDNKNKLAVDPYASRIVRDIFAWKLEGLSHQAIADRLNDVGEPSPLEYKRLLGWRFATSFQTLSKARWTAVAVGRILQNPVYAGHLIQGRESTPNHKIKRRLRKPEHQWIRVENTHEPIISQEMFHLANRLLTQDTRISPKAETAYPFSGLLFCADCKSGMVRRTIPSGGKKYIYYYCSQNKAGGGCATHCISEQALEKAVLKVLQQHIALLDGERVFSCLETLSLGQEELQKIDHQLRLKQEEIQKYQSLLASLYEDWKSGILDDEEYLEFQTIYRQKCRETKEATQKLQQERSLLLADNGKDSDWVETFRQHQAFTKLSRKAAVSLLERIEVHSGGRVEIYLRYRDEWGPTVQKEEAV